METVGLARLSRPKVWKMLARPTFFHHFCVILDFLSVLDSQRVQAIVQEIMKIMDTIGFTNSFHNFHDFWNYVFDSQSPQAIVPEIMEIVESIGFRNSFHEFGSKNQGNYW